MPNLNISDAINRFKTNEDRFDKFVNDDIGYETSDNEAVESIKAFLARKEQEIGSGVKAVDTLASLNSDLSPEEGVTRYVLNDPTITNNGLYRKSGASGSGSWVASSFDRVALIENNIFDTIIFGRSVTPINGSTNSDNTFVFANPTTKAGYINSVSIYNPTVSNKTFTLRRFTLSGPASAPTLTKVAGSNDLTLTLLPGLNIIAVYVPMNAGENIGFHAGNSTFTYTVASGDSGGFYASQAGGDQTVFTDADGANTATRIEISFSYKQMKISNEDLAIINAAVASNTANIAANTTNINANTGNFNAFVKNNFSNSFRKAGGRDYNASASFTYGSGGTAFYEWGIGILRGSTVSKNKVISKLGLTLDYSATLSRIDVLIYGRQTNSVNINSAPGIAEDILISTQSISASALGFAQDVFGFYELVLSTPLADTTQSYYVLIRGYDSGNNRIPIGCGKANNYIFSQLERGFYRQSSIVSAWQGISTSAAVALSVYETVYDPSTVRRNIGTRIFGGRMEYPFNNTTPKTFRTVFTLAAQFDAIRVIFSHAGNSAVTIASAAVAPLSSAANFACAGVNWKPLTFDGAASGNIPPQPGTYRRGFIVSDWVDISSVARSDVAGALPLLAVSAYVSSAATLTLLGKSDGSDSFTNWATHPTRPHVMRYNDGDCVTTPANFIDTTNRSTSPIVGIQYKAKGKVVTIMCAGDSISEGRGTYLGGNFAFQACLDKQNNLIAFEYANIAWSGMSSAAISNQIVDILAVGIKPDILFVPNGSPNTLSVPIVSGNIDTCRTEANNAISNVLNNNVVPVAWLMLPTNPISKDYNSSDSLRRSYNDEWRTLAGQHAGVVIADFDAKLAGITDGDGQVNLLAGTTTDGIHPNDTGEGLLKVTAKAAIDAALPLIGVYGSGLIVA